VRFRVTFPQRTDSSEKAQMHDFMGFALALPTGFEPVFQP
jgi:hypothetical protein